MCNEFCFYSETLIPTSSWMGERSSADKKGVLKYLVFPLDVNYSQHNSIPIKALCWSYADIKGKNKASTVNHFAFQYLLHQTPEHPKEEHGNPKHHLIATRGLSRFQAPWNKGSLPEAWILILASFPCLLQSCSRLQCLQPLFYSRVWPRHINLLVVGFRSVQCVLLSHRGTLGIPVPRWFVHGHFSIRDFFFFKFCCYLAACFSPFPPDEN